MTCGCSRRETPDANGASQLAVASTHADQRSDTATRNSDNEPFVRPAQAATLLSAGSWPGNYSGHRQRIVNGNDRTHLLRVSPAGRYLAAARSTGDRSGSLKLWDVETGKLIDEIFSPSGITAIEFTPDDKVVGYGTGDREVVLLEIGTRRVRQLKGHRLPIRHLAFSPDSQRLVTVGNDKRLIVWDVDQGVEVAESIEEVPAATVAFGDSSHVWTWNGGDVIRWFEVGASALTLQSTETIESGSSAGTAQGRMLCVANGNQSLKVIDAKDRQIVWTPTPPHSTASHAGAESPPGNQILSALCVTTEAKAVAAGFHDGKVTVWSNRNSAEPRTIELPGGAVRLLSVDRDGLVFAACSESGRLSVFRGDNPSDIRTLDAAGIREAHPVAPRFSQTSESLIDLADSSHVKSIRLSDGQPNFKATRAGSRPGKVTVVCSGPAESAMCGTDSGFVEVFKSDVPNELEYQVSETAITALACSPRGDAALVGDQAGITAWVDPFGSRPVQRFAVHESAIVAAQFSSRGRWAVTVDEKGSVRIWETSMPRPGEPLPGLEARVRAVAFSADDQFLATGDENGVVTIWDVKTLSRLWSWTMSEALRRGPPRHTTAQSERSMKSASALAKAATGLSSLNGITALRFRDDGELLAVGSVSGYVQTINVRQKRPLTSVFHQTSVSDLAFDHETLLVATIAGDVFRCWQESEPPLFLSAHHGPVRFAALDAGGQRAVTGGHDKRLCIWDASSGSLLSAIDNDGESIACGALAPNGLSAVTGGYGSGIVFWDLGSMKRLAKMYGHQKRVQTLAFSSDARLVASGSEDGTAKIWDAATRKARWTIPHDAPVHFVAFSPDNTRLLTSTLDPHGWQFPSRVRLFDVATGKPLLELKGNQTAINAAAYSSDGQTVMAGGADGQICRWSTSTGKLIEQSGDAAGLSHLGLVDNGRTLAAKRYNDGIVFYDAASLKQVAEFDVATRSVGDFGVAPHGDRVIAGTEEGAVYIWNVRHER